MKMLLMRVLAGLIVLSVTTLAALPVRAQSEGTASATPRTDIRIDFAKAGTRRPAKLESVRGVLVLPVVIAGRDAWAMLDNRVETSLVDIGFARSAGIAIGPAIGPLRTPTGTLPRWRVDAVPFVVPGQISVTAPFAGVDLSVASAATGRPIAMVIGKEYFAGLEMAISVARGTLQLGPSGSLVPSAVAIALTSDRPHVTVNVGGRTASVTIDLGYNGALALGDAAWERLGLAAGAQTQGRTTNLQGQIFTVSHTRLPVVGIGDTTLQDIDAGRQPILPLDGDGLLGMGALGRFDVVLDTKARRMWLLPVSGK